MRRGQVWDAFCLTVRKCDIVTQLSLKNRIGMKFLRSIAAALVLCGATSSLTTPVIAQSGVPSMPYMRGATKTWDVHRKSSMPTSGSMNQAGSTNQVGAVNQTPSDNFARRRHQEMQSKRATLQGVMSGAFLRGSSKIVSPY